MMTMASILIAIYVLNDDREEECTFCHDEEFAIADNGQNLGEFIRPCRCIGSSMGYHYPCVVYMIKAYKDKPCGACQTQYTDPRIRRVRTPLWHYMKTTSFMQESAAFAFMAALIHHLFFSYREEIDYWSDWMAYLGYFGAIVLILVVFGFTSRESIVYWRKHEGAHHIEFDFIEANGSIETEEFSLAEQELPFEDQDNQVVQ